MNGLPRISYHLTDNNDTIDTHQSRFRDQRCQKRRMQGGKPPTPPCASRRSYLVSDDRPKYVDKGLDFRSIVQGTTAAHSGSVFSRTKKHVVQKVVIST